MAEADKTISLADKAESNSPNDDKSALSHVVYQFKITLNDTKPPIWRRILILSNSTFAELHYAVNGAMGWLDSHLHLFHSRNRTIEIGPESQYEDEFSSQLVETEVKISEYFKNPKDSMKYVYDFGDHWLHSIVLEKILPYDNSKSYPICIAGRRACPPDDCGGVYGYKRLLETLSNPNDPEHQDMKDWMAGLDKDNFDPNAFDPVAACNFMSPSPFEMFRYL